MNYNAIERFVERSYLRQCIKEEKLYMDVYREQLDTFVQLVIDDCIEIADVCMENGETIENYEWALRRYFEYYKR